MIRLGGQSGIDVIRNLHDRQFANSTSVEATWAKTQKDADKQDLYSRLLIPGKDIAISTPNPAACTHRQHL